MIFVTVGGQIPFDRLIRAVDDWAGVSGRSDVFAQIGPTDYQPKNLQYADFLSPDEFREKVQSAELTVAHAGMGSILTALELSRPILVLPRRGHLRETRNDHQYGTAMRLKERGLIEVAMDTEELTERLDAIEPGGVRESISDRASPRLIETLRSFIEGS